jgi:hypothetical protein
MNILDQAIEDHVLILRKGNLRVDPDLHEFIRTFLGNGFIESKEQFEESISNAIFKGVTKYVGKSHKYLEVYIKIVITYYEEMIHRAINHPDFLDGLLEYSKLKGV